MMPIKIKLAKGAKEPTYQTEGSSGFDFYALLDSDVVLPSGKTLVIPTGVYMEIPVGWEVQIRPRSGLARKNGITVLNTPGTIDSDYRGEIQVLLYNTSQNDFTISNGMRIAQGVIAESKRAVFEIVNSLSKTERADKGFGSTGTN